MRKFLFVCAGLASLVGGCATTETTGSTADTTASVPAHELTGTKWRLVQFQSSDDTIGTIVPPNVENYTLEFMADGSLAMRLDCNRGAATWKAGEKTATGGAITISEGALTRAMCQPGAIDTRLAADMARVSSFTMADGQLHLALAADGGIYSWEPLPAS